MLNIVSDPTVYPIREARLVRNDGSSAVKQITPSPGIRDIPHERPDRGFNVVEFPRASDLTIELENVDHEVGRVLDELSGLSAFGRARSFVRLFPNLDASTWLSAPMTGHLRAWRRDLSADAMEVVTLHHQRTNQVVTLDEYGRFETVAANQPAFAPSVIGRGLYQTDSNTENQLASPHPSSGSLDWILATTGELDWVTELRSPHRAAGGCVQFRNAGASVTAYRLETIDTAARRWTFEVWLRGRGTMTLELQFGVGSSGSTTFDLTDTWRPYYVTAENDTATTSAFMNLRHESADHQVCHIGPAALRQSSDVLRQAPALWTGSNENEQVAELSGVVPPDVYTIAFAGRIPPNEAATFDFLDSDAIRVSSAVDQGRGYIVANPQPSGDQPFVYFDQVGEPGDPFVAVVRSRPDRSVVVTLATSNGRVSNSVAASSNSRSSTYVRFGGYARSVGLSAPQFFRIDERVWSDSEVQDYAEIFMHPGLRDTVRRTFGKLFRISGINLRPSALRNRALSGTVQLSEVGTDADFVVA